MEASERETGVGGSENHGKAGSLVKVGMLKNQSIACSIV